jgi:hypothetical protein
MIVTSLLISVCIAILFGIPIAVALGLIAAGTMVLAVGPDLLIIFIQRTYAGTTSFPLLAIPFFVLAGNLMNAGGTTERIFRVAQLFVGRIRGGLAHVGFDLFAPAVDFAFEKGARFGHARGVGFHGHDIAVLLDFGPGVVVKFPRPVGLGHGHAIGKEDAELLPHLVKRAPDGLLVGEGAEVAAGVGRAGSNDAEAGEGVGEVDPDLGELLIVPEQDIPAGAPAFDQFAL